MILVKELASKSRKAYDLAIFTLDGGASAEKVARYADRWSIEPSNATGKQLAGVGEARNRKKHAVERTVPFGFLVQSLVTIWYSTSGYAPADIDARRAAQPWYQSKHEPSFEDMIDKLRHELLKARFSRVDRGQDDIDQIGENAWPAAVWPRNRESRDSTRVYCIARSETAR